MTCTNREPSTPRARTGTQSDVKLFLHAIKLWKEKILGKLMIFYLQGGQFSIFTNSNSKSPLT